MKNYISRPLYIKRIEPFIDKSIEEFYKLKYCSTVVYMVPRA